MPGWQTCGVVDSSEEGRFVVESDQEKDLVDGHLIDFASVYHPRPPPLYVRTQVSSADLACPAMTTLWTLDSVS